MDYVNLYGGITFMEKPVDAAVQFSGLSLYELMNPSEVVSVSIVAFELNEIPQNQMMISSLVFAAVVWVIAPYGLAGLLAAFNIYLLVRGFALWAQIGRIRRMIED